MKKLYRIKIHHEMFVTAETPDEALEIWMDNIAAGEGMNSFLDNIHQVDEIEEAQELMEDE